MKIFQILDGWCHHDCSREFANIEATVGKFHPSIVFVEAPDYVFEGWAFDADADGDARFIKPKPPEGWLYDDKTGTYYPDGEIAPSKQPTDTDILDALLGVNE